MTKLQSHLIAAAAAALLAGAAVWALKPSPAAGPAVVKVAPAFMEHERAQLAHPSIAQKLTTRAVKPDQVRIAEAPSAPGRLAVAMYCAPAIALQTSAPDSTTSHHNAPPSLLPDFGGRRAGARLSLYSTLGDGRRWATDYTARGRISWSSSGDSVLVRGDRLWVRLARGAGRCAPAIGGTAAVGLLVDGEKPLRGALLGGVATALGCMF